MKIAVILVAIFGIVLCEQVELKFDKCIRLKMDATIGATVSVNGTQEASGEESTSSTGTVVSGGSCNLRSMTIYFNNTETKMILTFTTNNETVSLLTMIQLNAKSMFPDKNFTDEVALSQENKMTLSKTDESYKCNAETEWKFKPETRFGNKYEVSFAVKNFQVQAYELPETDFSTPKECAADLDTTAGPTEADTTTTPDPTSEETTPTPTEAPTSETERTTEETTTMEPSTPTTTAPAPSPNTYEVKDGNETCVKMVAVIEVFVKYETTDNTTETKRFFVPSTATADGTCGNGTESNATLTIMYDNDTIEFLFTDTNQKEAVDMVTLTVLLDAKRFPNATEAGTKKNFTTTASTIEHFDDKNFYMCNVGDQVKFEGASLDITELKLQAFNLKDGDFSDTDTECAADSTTMASTSTHSPTTEAPKPSGPPVNNFTVHGDNGTCLMMKASLVLDITYTTKDKKKATKAIAVPQRPPTSGMCGDTVETLVIKPFPDWEINMVFSAADSVSADENLEAVNNYELANITIKYKLDDHFPDSNETGVVVTTGPKTVGEFKAGVKGSYKCNANTTVKVNSDVSLKISNFRYQAFQANSTDFNDGDLQECSADIETNSVVPIAVGAALAGLVVIVLIAYLIGRRKSRRQGYESV